ncbi:MAG: NUDIX domain-containing protein [Limimaricola sp.]|uniref:NUDIX hydrolase n=1 Tax=Limimaricola sp. TaxID=2211665 RepID=UPI001DC49E56|nr:NUDIX hydrolase [Limimaricola sp.]MBI1418979.1 NUDIX domain-containing protein [Limimaricola sp.]
MSLQTPTQLPLRLRRGAKTTARTQFAALCFRVVADSAQICLVTSRGTGRWVLPKGWPMHKQTPAEAAATEAWEEAGLTGDAIDLCLGVYSYIKPRDRSRTPVIALVYPVHVTAVHTEWPEQHQRKRKWFPIDQAAARLAEPELRQIVATFDPRILGR